MVRLSTVQNRFELSALQIEKYLGALPDYMQHKARQFRFWQDKQAYIFGKLLINRFLKDYTISSGLQDLLYNAYSRPYLPGLLDFNISHGGAYIVGLVSDECRVGIDIEKIEAFNYEGWENQFPSAEWQRIKKACSLNNWEPFYNFWTKKEAILKAHGTGLILPTPSFSSDKDPVAIEDQLYYSYKVEIDKAYCANYALSKKLKPTQFSEVSIEALI
ncbi:MAG: hypothetical protein NVS9B7_11540 [Flavisolibacter sp.]